MSVQFILMSGIDAGILLLLLRQRGIWQRIRSAPLRKSEFILARALATALISAFQLTVIFAAAALIFGTVLRAFATRSVISSRTSPVSLRENVATAARKSP